MQGFVQGTDRQQTTLFPECLDDWVDEGNSIRAVDVFVDALELRDPRVRWRRSGSDRPACLSSFGDAQALHLRLSQPGAIEPAAGARGWPQSGSDVADRMARAGSQNHRRLP